jgi:hypothetical protein
LIPLVSIFKSIKKAAPRGSFFTRGGAFSAYSLTGCSFSLDKYLRILYNIIMKITKETWKPYLPYLKLILTLAVLLAVMSLLQVPCIIKYLTGISCPGCGMSRACISALQLDFAAAFAYHPLWIALPFSLGGLLLCKIRGYRRAFAILLSISVLLLVAVYLWRMLAGCSDVVAFEPQNGLIARSIRAIFRI